MPYKSYFMSNQYSLFGSDDEPAPRAQAGLSGSMPPKDSVTPEEPLAARMRPRTLDEIVGQEHLLKPGHPLRRTIEHDSITSMILWGPPGSGKTTLAEVIAHQTRARFARLSAVSAGVADLRKIVDEARKLRQFARQDTILVQPH
jgi:putative ATPase